MAVALACGALATSGQAEASPGSVGGWTAKVRSSEADVWRGAPTYVDGRNATVAIVKGEEGDRAVISAGSDAPSHLSFLTNPAWPPGPPLPRIEEPRCSFGTSFVFSGYIADWYTMGRPATPGWIDVVCRQSSRLKHEVLVGADPWSVGAGAGGQEVSVEYREPCAVALRTEERIDFHVPPGCRAGVKRTEGQGKGAFVGGPSFAITLQVTFARTASGAGP